MRKRDGIIVTIATSGSLPYINCTQIVYHVYINPFYNVYTYSN